MGPILKRLRESWESYAVLFGLVVAVAAFASLPRRVAALEVAADEWQDEKKFIVCVLGSQIRGYDSKPCETHLDDELWLYLIPPEPATQ